MNKRVVGYVAAAIVGLLSTYVDYRFGEDRGQREQLKADIASVDDAMNFAKHLCERVK